MSKHTTGPWNIGCANVKEEAEIGIHGPGADGFVICDLQADGYDEDTQKANAKLIAAAPDLLDALTQCRAELLSMIDTHNKQDADDGSWLYDYQTVVEADAAIAKARGEA